MAADRRAYEEIIDLFARGTSSADVLAFRPSEESQERVVTCSRKTNPTI